MSPAALAGFGDSIGAAGAGVRKAGVALSLFSFSRATRERFSASRNGRAALRQTPAGPPRCRGKRGLQAMVWTYVNYSCEVPWAVIKNLVELQRGRELATTTGGEPVHAYARNGMLAAVHVSQASTAPGGMQGTDPHIPSLGCGE